MDIQPASREDDLKKIVYEKPRLMSLDLKGGALGQTCNPGSGAGPNCHSGAMAQKHCQNGIAAPMKCKAGSTTETGGTGAYIPERRRRAPRR